jgi:AraC-like DNA-binding protein
LNTQEHLALRLMRLKSPEELEQKGEGLFFLFSKGGAGKYVSKTATHSLLPGDVLAFEGTTGSKLVVDDKKGEFLFWAFSVCFENLLPLFAVHEISLLHNITEGFKAAKIYPARSPLAMECQRLLMVVPPQFNLDHRGQLIRIAATILSAQFQEGQSLRSGGLRPEDHMVETFEKLSASELINLSVSDLAGRFNCSRRHLNRLFHQHFGVSVSALRMEMRLLKAVSLLRDANLKIINVAEQCGFNHLGLFNTCFRRRFGTSPGQWRKSPVPAAKGPARKLESKPAGSLQSAGSWPLAGQVEGTSSNVMASFADKITDGAIILEDLKRRDLMFGSQALSNSKRNLPQARAGE